MVHTNIVGAAVAATTSSRQSRPRLPSSGSFHAGDMIPSSLSPYDMGDISRPRRSIAGLRRTSTTPRYHTFPTQPPKTPSDIGGDSPTAGAANSSDDDSDLFQNVGHGHEGDTTPLPIKQLGLLALLSLCEQTALNSISPYLPEMVSFFDEIPSGQTGLYVGILASAFALAQLTTNLMWGYLSDRVGRKPVLLLGSSLLMVCFAFFGFCTTYWQVVVVHVAMGLLNGNAVVVPTCLGEVTDRTNQSRAFIWLPVMYSIGGITGPALGGLLVSDADVMYPYLAPNVGSAALLFASVVVLSIWFDETLDDAEKKAAGAGLAWVEKLCECGRRRRKGRVGSWSSRWPTREQCHPTRGDSTRSSSSSSSTSIRAEDEGQSLLSDLPNSVDDAPEHFPVDMGQKSVFRQLLNHTTILVLLTYLVFQLANISFNSLYPIFASSPPDTGRDMSPETIGLLLAFAGFFTIAFQVFVFQPLKTKMGNLATYRAALFGLAVSMGLMPWVGYKNSASPPFGLGSSKWWLYAEMAAVLVIKNVCAVGGLSSVLLLITNAAPSHETLGTLNGIAQTLSAAGRSVGPFLSGGLFTLSTHIQPKGELLAWGLFAGISLVGWLGSLGINGRGLESEDWEGADDDGSDDEHTGHGEAEP